MKRIKIAGACVVIAAAIGAAVTSESYAYVPSLGPLLSPFPSSAPVSTFSPTTPALVSQVLAGETAALMRKGISAERASQALAVQSRVDRTDLVSKIEAAMGNAYAQVWFEPAAAQLDIGVTSPASRLVAEGIVAQAGLTSDVTETPVRSTWAQLLAAQMSLDRRLRHLFARNQVETALAPQHNAVTVTLSASAPKRERSVIDHEAAAAKVKVIVTIVKPRKLRFITESTPTLCSKFGGELKRARCDAPITAGVTIRSDKGEICTAGPMAIPNDESKETLETYLLTAGHCIDLSSGAEKWYAFNRAGEEKEIGEAQKAISGTSADIGAILVSILGYWTAVGNTPVYADVASWGLSHTEPYESFPESGYLTPTVGKTNCIEGQTSGELCGDIIALNGVAKTTQNLAVDEGFTTEKGDSGAPYISTDVENSVLLVEGTHVGKTSTENPAYEPLETSFKELKALVKLDLKLLTTANETRKPCPMMN
jgi:hypothetical protein